MSQGPSSRGVISAISRVLVTASQMFWLPCLPNYRSVRLVCAGGEVWGGEWGTRSIYNRFHSLATQKSLRNNLCVTNRRYLSQERSQVKQKPSCVTQGGQSNGWSLFLLLSTYQHAVHTTHVTIEYIIIIGNII